MRCFAASATAMSTPASAYFMQVLFAFVGYTGARKFLSFSFGRILVCRRAGSATLLHFAGDVTLKSPEQSLPANQARMHQRVRVGKKALANLPGLPSVWGNIERHIYHHGRADNVVARHGAPEAAVIGVSAVVAHHEIRIVWNFEWLLQVVGIGAADGVIFLQFLTVYPDGAVVDLNRVSGQADYALDVVGRIRRKGRLENYYLLAMGTTP